MKKFLKYAVIFLATTSLCFAQGDQKVKIYQSVRTGAQSATGWTDDGTDVYLTTTSDSVGIGTTDPGTELEVVGTINATTDVQINGSSCLTAEVDPNAILTDGSRSLSGDWDNADFDISTLGSVGIGTTAPTELLDVNNLFVVESGGNVGIGTTAPASKLEVDGDITIGDDDWIGISSSTERIIFDSTGDDIEIMGANVGIGTTDPGSYKLYVEGDTYIGGVTVTNGSLNFGGNLDMENSIITNIGNAGTDFLASTGGLNLAGNLAVDTNVLYVDTSSNEVGIGTAAPNKNLQLQFSSSDAAVETGNGLGGGAAGSGFLIYNSNTTTNSYANLDFRSNNADARIAYRYTGTTNKGDFHFITDNTGSPQTKMVILDSGNVGIGTTNPTKKLEVRLSDAAGADEFKVTDSAGTHAFTVDSDGNILFGAYPATVSFNNANTTGIGNIAINDTGANEGMTWLGTNFAVDVCDEARTNGTTDNLNLYGTAGSIVAWRPLKLKGTSSNLAVEGTGSSTFAGNVGIGTTAPATELEVVGTITGDVTGDLTGNASTVTNGIYTTSTWTGGELSGTGLAPTINDSVAVTSWNLTTPTITRSLTTDSKTISEAEIGRLDGLANTIVTDNNSCTDVEGKGLVITTGTLNWTAASTDLSDTANILLLNGGGTLTANVIANANLSVGNAATTAGVLTLLEDDDDGSNFASFMVPALTANTVYTLPTATGGAGEVLTDAAGNGTLSWAAGGGAEVNNLETVCTGIATTEIFVGNAANAGVYTALSGDVSMDNLGDVTVSTAAACSGESATVATITGLAPDTATTAAAQTAITSLGTLTGLSVGIGNTVPLTVLTTNNGRVGIGTTAPTTALQVVGTITGDVTGALTGQSDTVATITGLAPDTQNTYARTQYLIPYASTTTAFGQIAIGTDGQVLTSAGAGVAPAFETAAGVTTLQEAFDGGQTITIGDGDNQTLAITNNDVTNDPNTMTITNTGDKHGLYIAHTTTAQAVGYHGLYVQSTTANIAADAALIKIHQDNASSTEPALEIYNDGTGKALEIVNIGAGIGFFVEANTNFNEGACAAYIYDGNQEKTTGLGLLYVRANHASTSIPTIIINHKGSGVQIQGEGDENLSNAGVWTDRTSTFADKEVIDEIKGLEFIDKLRALKLYSYRKKSEIYGNKRRDEVEITEEEYDEENLSHSKKDKKFYKEIGEEKYPTVKKRPAARIFKGYILDDPTTPQELISRDLDGNMNGVSAADGVNFLLGVCKELINRIDELEARIEALE